MGTGIGLLAGAAVVGLVAWFVDRRWRAYADQATTPAVAVFAGRNEVKGKAWVADPLTSRRTQAACVWWTYLLEEEREHIRTVTDTDSEGRTSTRTERYRQWHEIDRDEGSLPGIEVVDETGSVHVTLPGARIEPRDFHSQVFRQEDGRGFLAKMLDVDNRTGRYRETEKGIAVGDQLFVVGDAVLDDASAVPYLDGDLVSTRSEESRSAGIKAGAWLLATVAVVGAGSGSALTLPPHELREALNWGPGLGVAALALVAAWCTITYNRLHLLSQGVERAAALIDVQLKRRHDLVGALARVVAAHAAHERELLAGLTTTRAGAGGAVPTDAATQTAELRQVLAVAEAHPELTADESFLNLQRQLADTETRIAGSRTFYNDSVTLIRNLSHRFPGVLIARLVSHPRADLTAAQGFERTTPEVAPAFG